MLTKEQIKNLKRGTPIVIRTTFNRVDEDGDIWFRAPTYIGGSMEDCIHPSFVSLPSEHGTSVPTTARPFKKGDKVRVVERDGRSPILCGAVVLGGTYTVHEDEDNGDVILDIGYGALGGEPIAWSFLELVTPVEELESFGVRYSTDRDCAEVYHRRYKNTVAAFYCKCGITREQAEEHAEAECKRLNEEYRKEQK